MKSLEEIERQISCKTEAKDRVIKGIWGVDCLFNPVGNGRIFDYKILISQTLGQGCAYSSHNQYSRDVLKSYIGRDFLKCDISDTALKISLMDSIYGILYPPQNVVRYVCDATSEEKMHWRTSLIVDEAKRLLGEIKNKRVVNVGVVGDILLSFSEQGATVIGTDFDEALIGGQVFNGIEIYSGDRTLDEIASADLAVVTGMTISTETIDEILSCAVSNNTKIILFAETGASLSSYYIQRGVDVYLSEYFPFYIFNGSSVIDISRSN